MKRLPLIALGLLVGGVALAQSEERTPEEEIERATRNRMAAEQGDAFAQEALAVQYRIGAGVPRDYVAAYAWMNVAAVRSETAVMLRNMLADELTADELIEANRLAREIWERIEWPLLRDLAQSKLTHYVGGRPKPMNCLRAHGKSLNRCAAGSTVLVVHVNAHDRVSDAFPLPVSEDRR